MMLGITMTDTSPKRMISTESFAFVCGVGCGGVDLRTDESGMTLESSAAQFPLREQTIGTLGVDLHDHR
jgi:hypothetical protein